LGVLVVAELVDLNLVYRQSLERPTRVEVVAVHGLSVVVVEPVLPEAQAS
jgi:hypothetical protein